ncbi:YrbL family protein [Selenomonas ruminantium]|uniref:PhoP regulatory network protein YrbL n=1 Tax=Selenomonas ruminantium TaxID=971 RepID=A0A1H0PK99_SELRU|nr:YrbL family protein [Selenomonas ruminantium]SDP05039.1 PhoP regulatory network protein YrbL [Selenomonas ruminantium]
MLMISDALYLGRGLHKVAYIHPENENLVIKIPFDPKDAELRQELSYRKSRKFRNLDSQLLTKFYGPVETDKGQGYVFERIRNADGTACETLGDYLDAQEAAGWPDKEEVCALLQGFMKQVMDERILTNDTCLINFLLQRNEAGEIRIRIIDNVGSPVKIPLVYYWDHMTVGHIRRYLKRLQRDLQEKYGRDLVLVKS